MSYFVKIHEPKARASARGFATHKSARSFARRAIREGADFVSIAFRPADAEGDESDALRNVYRAEVDTVNHVRRHVRIPVDTWRDFAARLAASAKSGARK